MFKKKPIAYFLVGSALVTSACGADDPAQPSGAQAALEQMPDVSAQYAAIVHASYKDSLDAARELGSAVAAFVDAPSEASLGAARDAWLAAREPYLQTEVYRFYEGPIDGEDGPEGFLNAWPLDEAYIDYVEGDDEAGIVNDTSQDITGSALEGLNEQGGEKNIATGYHAVEFLLWGQDLSETGPGNRPATDYSTGEDATHDNQDRRAKYLTTVTDLIAGHLEDVVEAWAPDQEDNYRAEFEAAAPEEALRRILTGMIVLSGFETGGERLQAALDTGDQEDEHSCFSDNTHRDMIQDVQGVQNVYRGRYEATDGTTVSGAGVEDVVRALDPDLAEELADRIEKSLDLANALHTPFDREIATDNPDGRERVQALIDSLRTQENLLEEVFQDFDLEIPEPE